MLILRNELSIYAWKPRAYYCCFFVGITVERVCAMGIGKKSTKKLVYSPPNSSYAWNFRNCLSILFFKKTNENRATEVLGIFPK